MEREINFFRDVDRVVRDVSGVKVRPVVNPAIPSTQTGVRERLAGTLVQDTGAGEPHASHESGGQEGPVAAVFRQVGRQAGVLALLHVRR